MKTRHFSAFYKFGAVLPWGSVWYSEPFVIASRSADEARAKALRDTGLSLVVTEHESRDEAEREARGPGAGAPGRCFILGLRLDIVVEAQDVQEAIEEGWETESRVSPREMVEGRFSGRLRDVVMSAIVHECSDDGVLQAASPLAKHGVLLLGTKSLTGELGEEDKLAEEIQRLGDTVADFFSHRYARAPVGILDPDDSLGYERLFREFQRLPSFEAFEAGKGSLLDLISDIAFTM